MVQGPSADLISAIRSPASLDAQIASLKQLKNDIVGHDQRKELVVRQGLVEPLVGILAAPSKAAGKRSANGVQLQPISSWTLEEEARLQATLILGSLASGGLAFVRPLLAASTGKYLLDALSTETAPRLVTATLQALRNLVRSASIGDEALLEQFDLPIETFKSLLHHSSAASDGKQQQKLAAEIISLSAAPDSKRRQLANGGLLDALASLLAAHAIDNKHVEHRGSTTHLPPAPPLTTVPTILSAITAIVKGSNFRIQSFILSQPIRELFGKASLEGADLRLVFGSRNGSNPTESLLPPLHIPVYKSVSFNDGSSAFPVLGSLKPVERRGETSQYPADIDHANAVLSWLIFLARSMQGLNRLIALRLLALVNLAIEADTEFGGSRSETFHRARERERQLAMLAIPLAVSLIRAASEEKSSVPKSAAQEQESQEVQEQSCDVLALLILGNKELQTAAVDAGAIKHICPIFKQSLDAVTISKPMWSAQPAPDDTAERPESCIMGARGLPREIRHVMNCRQSALEALAALAKKEDIHRKAIVEAGVVSCIIDSLKPLTPEFIGALAGGRPPQQFTAKDGNTTAVILAACHAAQSMSRSVSLLRTSLIDAGIARPVFELLKDSDFEIQIAATNVCCNLLLEFSPMRDDLLGAGAIKTLTEHARQSKMGLRLASLWALKHLVLSSTRDVKKEVVDELGIGWLVGAIQGEYTDADANMSHSTSGGVSVSAGGLSAPNAAGEQVDLLNPATSMDVDDPAEDDDEDEDGEVLYDEAAGTHYQSSGLRSTLHNPPHNAFVSTSPGFNSARYLRSVRDLEQNPALQAKRDDIAVQEQALDFVRNMLNGEDCAWTFEWLLHAIGQDKVFALLSDKLAPISTPQQKSSNTNNNKPVYQPMELILSTVHVITHIANASPTHKQLLIAQKDLLRNWLPHFSHPDRRVRVICVWAINSLTWVEDDADRAGAIRRAAELRHCGIEAAIRSLAADPDLDVRERVKTAIRQIDAL